MEDDFHSYENGGNAQDSEPGGSGDNESNVYQLPSHSSQINEYQLPSSNSRDHTHETKVTDKSRKMFVTVGVLMTIFVILTAIALTLAALGYQKAEWRRNDTQQLLRKEINELHSQLQQLRSHIGEICNMTDTLIIDELQLLQGNFALVNNSVYGVKSDISSLDNQLQYDISAVNNHLSFSISSVSATQSSQISAALQTVSSGLSRSVGSVSSRFSSSLSRSISSVSRFSNNLSGSISSVSSSLSDSISSVSSRFSSRISSVNSKFSSRLSRSITSVNSRCSSICRSH